MFNHRKGLVACIVVIAGLTVATQAWAPSKVNHLTFKRAVALPGVVLAPGAYTFESGPAGSNPEIVQVKTRDGKRVLYTGFTLSVRRPAEMPRSQAIAFAEAAPGEAVPVSAWYPIDSSTGHEFLYR